MVIVFAIVSTLIGMLAISFVDDRRHLELDDIDVKLKTKVGDLAQKSSR